MAKFLLKTLLVFILTGFAFISKAQIGYDYAQYDIGVAGSANQVYGDVVTPKTRPSLLLNFDFNQTPFVNYILELQLGQLAGGDMYKDRLGRQFASTYSAWMFRTQVQAGEVLDYSSSPIANAFKNLYLSTGIGIVYNHINDADINRYSVQVPGFYTAGQNDSQQLVIPARIGYEFKIYNGVNEPSFKVDIGYQYNFVMGDNLDGFKVGSNNDSYSQIVLGVKFAIGGVTSYRKLIRY